MTAGQGHQPSPLRGFGWAGPAALLRRLAWDGHSCSTHSTIPMEGGTAVIASIATLLRLMRKLRGAWRPPHRHCERSEAIQTSTRGKMDCRVASLLAMTGYMDGDMDMDRDMRSRSHGAMFA